MPLARGLVQERLRHFVQAFEGLRRPDHELHRQTAAAGKRRPQERGRPRARDPVELLLDLRQQFHGRPLPLVPGFEHHAAERDVQAVRARELEHMVRLRIGGIDAEHLLRRELGLFQRGVGRRRGQGDDEALVLVRRQFALRGRVEEIDAHEDERAEHPDHGKRVERACSIRS